MATSKEIETGTMVGISSLQVIAEAFL